MFNNMNFISFVYFLMKIVVYEDMVAGITKIAFLFSTHVIMEGNPLSARTVSPGSNKSLVHNHLMKQSIKCSP